MPGPRQASYTASVIDVDVPTPDGRVLHAYDSGEGTGEGTVYWQHGAGMRGLPPQPLVERAAGLGLRLISHDRPGYGGSTARPGRSVADGVGDLVTVLDRLGVDSATTIGLSAGAMHALGAVALHPARFTAAAVLSGPAPYGAPGLDWFAGMAEPNRAEFEAALRGRDALAAHLAHDTEVDLSTFAEDDLRAMSGPYWDWQLATAETATQEGSIEDELACMSEWGFSVDAIAVPVLVLHGANDTFVPGGHAEWVAAAVPGAVLRLEPGGHISTVPLSEAALVWLRDHGRSPRPHR